MASPVRSAKRWMEAGCASARFASLALLIESLAPLALLIKNHPRRRTLAHMLVRLFAVSSPLRLFIASSDKNPSPASYLLLQNAT
ncbi:MAG: hypothetical protein MI924_01460 [Chloroflexales bacterium]|nr:hypothetical protein [Chloroflexales bacterium]